MKDNSDEPSEGFNEYQYEFFIHTYALIWFITDNERLPTKKIQITGKENVYFI